MGIKREDKIYQEYKKTFTRKLEKGQQVKANEYYKLLITRHPPFRTGTIIRIKKQMPVSYAVIKTNKELLKFPLEFVIKCKKG